MRILLVSTYELGHQPLHVAAPAAALRAVGHEVGCVDISVEPWEPDPVIEWAEAVGFSVPMHTAMRLAIPAARALKRRRPDLPIAFYGLYAPVSRDLTVGTVADTVLAGTYTPGLVAWADTLAGGRGSDAGHPPVISLARPGGPPPARDLLPPLERYAQLSVGTERRAVGYVEATQGCLHECRHCPVPTVYDGRFRAISREAVLEDIGQLVQMGARHITFGDPDFLNGPTHALRLVTEMHARWPELTFDCTTKVDHILDNAELWGTFAESGCLFVVSAFETLDDATLTRLDKGHTAAQAAQVIRLLRGHGIEVRPSWMPFTPWTSVRDIADILDFVAEHDLIGNVDPVQYTIRLLLPEGSLLVDHPELAPHLAGYDAEKLSYGWTAADPATDALQAELASLVERATDGPSLETYLQVVACVASYLPERDWVPVPPGEEVDADARPRLTEPWFCCAEPTRDMSDPLVAPDL